MNGYTVFMVVCFTLLTIFVTAYTIITNRIIKDQDKEIARLNKDLRKAEKLICEYSRKKVYKSAPQIIEIYDHRIDGKNIPIYGDN